MNELVSDAQNNQAKSKSRVYIEGCHLYNILENAK